MKISCVFVCVFAEAAAGENLRGPTKRVRKGMAQYQSLKPKNTHIHKQTDTHIHPPVYKSIFPLCCQPNTKDNEQSMLMRL